LEAAVMAYRALPTVLLACDLKQHSTTVVSSHTSLRHRFIKQVLQIIANPVIQHHSQHYTKSETKMAPFNTTDVPITIWEDPWVSEDLCLLAGMLCMGMMALTCVGLGLFISGMAVEVSARIWRGTMLAREHQKPPKTWKYLAWIVLSVQIITMAILAMTKTYVDGMTHVLECMGLALAGVPALSLVAVILVAMLRFLRAPYKWLLRARQSPLPDGGEKKEEDDGSSLDHPTAGV
jgi:hypothetical protein